MHMLIFTILEIGLGLAFVYLLLSLLASWINERVAAALQLRARGLETAIRNMLKDPPDFRANAQQYLAAHPEYQGYKTFADQFYSHPLVKSLGERMPLASKPTNISAQTFALVAFDILFPEEDFTDKTAEQLKDMIHGKRLHPDIETTLITYIEGGARNIESLRKGVETWFNDAMDQTSAWYKRDVGFRTLVIGAILAVLFNVDTLVIANALWQEPNMRTSLAEYAQNNLGSFEPGQEITSEDAIAKFSQVRDVLAAFDFPVGWAAYGPGTAMQNAAANNQAPAVALGLWLLYRLVGWALTAIAVAQGAPFWFDILKKAVAPSKTQVPSIPAT
jgi:hypothetical protein